ncbi:hypothetical protein QWY31_13490 [Cytophagales bacterium LB-30]|uniref:Uncharacterized protein n=1 Tax=Shiella aurantiaca TaxID=3058365 RepID=A0ABT8F8A6_9BACT|nr:hypothetical protein [Shiella aurantiaca]MDN4166518.1 hypothetical protein [Shiella aurantiaca]
MELLGDLLKILLPAGVMLYAMYALVQSFLKKDMEKKLIEIKVKSNETILPLRLQAYERMCLFLERITPSNLLFRLNDSSYNVAALHQILLSDIREEYNHNLSQQVYMSDKAWKAINAAREEVIMLINQCASELDADGRGIDLAKKILERYVERKMDSIEYALRFLKDEVQKIF